MHFKTIVVFLISGQLIACSEPIKTEVLRRRVEKIFYHSYNNYLEHAFPYDELRPLTCDGFETWGSFSLTLIDSLDTLVVLGNYSEFKRATDLILKTVNPNKNINVSVFETNIRVVGGLLSAHLLSHKAGLKVEPGWPCHGKLLDLAERFARKLLPAFDTPTGMPYGTVNLALGRVPRNETPVTCVATIGTSILEFGALSRLTGDDRFEKVAIKALRALWSHRSTSGLVGNHINVVSGQWVGEEATIGSGVDSYFEYLLKGSIMFRFPELDAMFREYRNAVKKYLKFGAWHFMTTLDGKSVTNMVYQSLESFWPGVLAMAGEIEEAKELLITYHSIWKKYGFLPELYDVKNARPVKRTSSYPLRPEFVESILYLYRVTKDPYLLEMGVDVLTSIEKQARTPCGFATIHDVQTHTLENRMESFFLSETVKYLYLLFDPDNFLHNTLASSSELHHSKKENDYCISGAGYIFNSEAHPLDGGLIDCCFLRRSNENDGIYIDEPISADLGLLQGLESFSVTNASYTSFTSAILNDIDATFEEILSPRVSWTKDEKSNNEMETWFNELWRDMSGIILLSSTTGENISFPLNYTLPNMHRRDAPLMSCPTVPFHVRLNPTRDMDYRNLDSN